MSGTQKIDLRILSNWSETLKIAFQKLRKTPFVVEDTFTWNNFDPLVDFQGMTVTGQRNRLTRFTVINKMLWISIHIQATLAAPFSNAIYITVPGTCPVFNGDTSGLQGGALYLANAGVSETGRWFFTPNYNVIEINRGAGGLYTAGLFLAILNTFVEIK